jgi:hypothetical protein
MSEDTRTGEQVALSRCRGHLLEARADAALAAGVVGLRTAGADGPMWILEAVEAVLRDLDRLTDTPSGDWDDDVR